MAELMDSLHFFYALADIKKGKADKTLLGASKDYSKDSLLETTDLLEALIEGYDKIRIERDHFKDETRKLFRQNMSLIDRVNAKETGHDVS